jgi:hypothetical protein
LAFLNPIFAFAGIGLVAIPIVIHLLNRRRFKVVEWAAMQYLLAALRKNRRRLQFESWLLLLLRCLALLLLALALSRPLGCNSAASLVGAAQVGLHVIVVDDSYSMAYQADRLEARTHFDQAKRLAKELLGRVGDGSQEVAIVTASRPARVLVRPTFNQQAIAEAIDRLMQSSSDTDIAGALRLAQQIAAERATLPSRTLYLLSDCTNSALRGPDAESIAKLGPELVKSYRVVVHDLSRESQSNVAITSLRTSEPMVRVGFGADVLATVQGFGAVGESRVDWKQGDRPLPGTGTLKPEPTTPPVVQSQATFDASGSTIIRATALSAGDRLPIDNERTRVVDVAGDVRVLLVEGRRGVGALQGSAAFLRLALAPPLDPTQHGKTVPRYIVPTVISDLELPSAALGENRAVVLAGVGSIRPELATALKAYVEQGGTLVIFAGDPVTADNYNQTLGAAGLLPGALVARVDASAADPGFLFDFDPANPHPVLSVFRDQPKSGLESVRVFSYWRVQIDPTAPVERVLSYRQLANNVPVDPAITLHRVGAGRVAFVTTSADAEWSTFVARQGAYVALVHELIAGAIGSGDAWQNLTVGDRVVIPPTVRLSGSPQLAGPGDRVRAMTLEGGRWTSNPLTEPGLYNVVIGAVKYPIAVNVSAAEADIRPLGQAGIKTALGEIEVRINGDSLDPEELVKQDTADFAWPLLLLLLPLLFGESLLAWKFGRTRPV